MRWRIALGIVIVIAVVRVAATHRVFSATLDEPAHLAAGYEWLAAGTYTIDVSHPPLARILPALIPWLEGVPYSREGNSVDQGNAVLFHGDRYEGTLARARMGNLVFLIAGILAVALWARRAFGDIVSIAAAALFSTLPPILAHAGLITTDMAAAATFPLALYALDAFLMKPDLRRGAFVGIAIALGILSKLSFFPFFVPTALVFMILRHRLWRGWFRGALFAIPICIAVVWAGYRFDFRRIRDFGDGAGFDVESLVPAFAQKPALWLHDHVPIPAPALPLGIALVKAHDAAGHSTYLLGRHSETGWWYYFPVVFFYKTPIPFLILTVDGIMALAMRRSGLQFILAAAIVMAVAMTSSINIGIRHILPIYAPLSIIAACGVVALWNRGRVVRTGVVLLMLWLFGGVALAHPDYLPWFNEFAGNHPERIVVDSNLDWGQDMLRLERVVRERGIDHLWFFLATSTPLDRLNVPAQGIEPGTRPKGWVAVSETALKQPSWIGEYDWLDQYEPVERVGKSIRLYRIQ
jgi:hypothetical protein